MQWKPLIMITLGPALFENNNRPITLSGAVAYPEIFFWGGFQQIQLRTKDRENGDLGTVAP